MSGTHGKLKRYISMTNNCSKNTIGLISRDGLVNSYLIEIERNKYEWEPSENTYYRVSSDGETVNFLDPDGGPLLRKGFEFDLRVIDEIKEENGHYILHLK